MVLSRWCLVAFVVVAVAAVVWVTVESPPAPGPLTPEQWRERAGTYFPGWQSMACGLMTLEQAVALLER